MPAPADSGLPENPYQPPQQSGPGPQTGPFHDRKSLILTMGILAIVAGAGFGCLGGLYAFAMPAFLAQAPEEARGGFSLDSGWMNSLMAMTGLLMAAAAAALIWLGIGAVRLRRWAGDLFLAGGWLYGTVFAFSVAITAVYLPHSMAQMTSQLQRGSQGFNAEQVQIMQVTMLVTMIVMFALYLVPPLMVILVFRLRSVKQTLAHYDRGPSWTDGLALPVLSWWVWLATMAVCLLTMAPTSGPMYQMMGLVTEGWQAVAAMLGFAAAAAFCAWAVMTRRAWSWYASLALALALGGLGWFVMGRMDLVEFYRKVGMSGEQLALMTALYGDGSIYKWIGISTLTVMVCFLLLTKRFYRFGAQENQAV